MAPPPPPTPASPPAGGMAHAPAAAPAPASIALGLATPAPSRRSAPLLVNNERPPAVLLCGSSVSEHRARRADRSRSRNFSGLRRAELACLRRFRSACGAFRSACGAETNQAKEPACGGSLLTCLLTRRGSVVVQQHPLLYSSTLRSAFVPSCFLLVVTRTDLWFCV